MDGTQGYIVQATVDQLYKVFARARFNGAGADLTLLLKKDVQGPDVQGISNPSPGLYRVRLREGYPVWVGGTAEVVRQFSDGANLFRATIGVDTEAGVIAKPPQIVVLVYNTTTGALSDPPANAQLLLEATLRNHRTGL
jgi:hypothetical protein